MSKCLLVAILGIVLQAEHAAALGCYENKFEPTKGCFRFSATTKLCTEKEEEAKIQTTLFGALVDASLSSKTDCANYWTPHCVQAGGTKAKEDMACSYACGLLRKASQQCTGACTTVTPIPSPPPSVKDVMDLSMSLVCCSWVKTALQTVCDTTDATKLDAYVAALQTTPVPFRQSEKMCSANSDVCRNFEPIVTQDACSGVLCNSGSSSSSRAHVSLFATLLAAFLAILAYHRF